MQRVVVGLNVDNINLVFSVMLGSLLSIFLQRSQCLRQHVNFFRLFT